VRREEETDSGGERGLGALSKGLPVGGTLNLERGTEKPGPSGRNRKIGLSTRRWEGMPGGGMSFYTKKGITVLGNEVRGGGE